MYNSHLLYSVALSVLSSPAGTGLYDLMERSVTPEFLYKSLTENSRAVTQPFVAVRYSPDPLMAAREILAEAEKGQIGVTGYWGSDYPPLLREISHPPVVLYHHGALDLEPAIAVVGTRKPDHASLKVTERIVSDLVSWGFSIVSGMALGIDRAAHTSALSGKGRTAGILANGIDILYPLGNRDLYDRIRSTAGSVLVSEYPPGIHAGKWTFVRRNRIISGLCPATVVIQAGERSGALITARYATEQNREVFACSGHSFDESYGGCHRLIRNGAHLLAKTADILVELPPRTEAKGKEEKAGRGDISEPEPSLPLTGTDCGEGAYPPDSPPYRILKYLGNAEVDIDTVIRNIGLTTESIHESLVLLELEGRVSRKGNVVSRSGGGK
ncbi:MAG: DNA-protecting protein DprA [Spirochaetae bacterium HGW-Spirochaetae-1]|jgi:DNA processing protein|nr:MAG: DNA-protecting protein DprA [Spirochaetae bacterium HGW-Spirochaetae-1]